jgi:SAM-dependent methyltransferase
MFYNLRTLVVCLFTGQFRRIWNEVHVRIYRWAWEILWHFTVPSRNRQLNRETFERKTDFPVAFESPDHIAPKGTIDNNSTNKKFILYMDAKIRDEFGQNAKLRMMDLGCSGGQTVADFMTLGWGGVGIEGSDASLKQSRANWAHLANTNLFTADITKPFLITQDGVPVRFHLITAWEVMEHIAMSDLKTVFQNIVRHLEPGGYFIGSTSDASDINDGIELHQTRWENEQWRAYVAKECPELEYTDVGLKIYQFVRYNFLRPSFLLYRKKLTVQSATGEIRA